MTDKFAPDGQLQSTWHVRRGSTFKKRYVWRSGPAGQELPVDMSAWAARGGMYQKNEDGTLTTIIALGTVQGNVDLGADGSITIVVPDSVTAAVTQKKGVFDLELVDAGASFVKNFIGGPVFFLEEYTK